MGRSILAGLLVVFLLLSTFLAVAPSLHRLLHDDADQNTHQCAITMLQQQQMLPDDPAPLLLDIPLSFVSFVSLIKSVVLPVANCRSFPSRAPPGFFMP